MSRNLKLLALALSLIFMLTACASNKPAAPAEKPKSGKPNPSVHETFTVALKAEPPNLDPHNHTTLVGFAIQTALFDTLVAQDEKGNIVPSLAKKWDVIDDRTVRFYLRDDVYFHNGEKMTAEDVRYSIERATQKKSSATLFAAFDGKNTKVVDEYTIDVKVLYPFAPVFNYLASSRGDIVCKKAVEEMGEAAFGRNPVGSGPFKFKKWVTGDRIELAINDKYWGNKPVYNNLIARFITEPANRAIELETGGVDAIYDVDAGDVARLEKNKEVKVVKGPSYKLSFITMNMRDKQFQDIRVRQALTYALDMDSIVKSVYKGSARTADSVMAPTVFGYKKVGPYPYDPEKSKALLAEVGYKNGLKVTFMTNDDRTFMDVAEIAQNMWKAVGIEAEVKVLDQATFLSTASAGKVSIGMSSSTPSTGDPDHALIVWPSTYGGTLQSNSKIIDDYITKGKGTYNSAEREKIYHETQDYIWSQNYMIPVAFTDAIYATRSNIENFECHPGSTPNLAKVTFKN